MSNIPNNINTPSPGQGGSTNREFSFGSTQPVVFGQSRPLNAGPILAPRRILGRAATAGAKAAQRGPTFTFNSSMTMNQAAQLLPGAPRQTHANLPDLVTSKLPNRATSDLSDYKASSAIPPLFPMVERPVTTNLFPSLTQHPPAANNIQSIAPPPISEPLAAGTNIPSFNFGLPKESPAQAATFTPPTMVFNAKPSEVRVGSEVKPESAAIPAFKPINYKLTGTVRGGSMAHPCISVLDPPPSLPSSVNFDYIKHMMSLNMAARDCVVELLDQNPFQRLDDIIRNALDDIKALDEKYPGCKAAMAKLDSTASGDSSAHPVPTFISAKPTESTVNFGKAFNSDSPKEVSTEKQKEVSANLFDRVSADEQYLAPSNSLKRVLPEDSEKARANPLKRASADEHEKAPMIPFKRVHDDEPEKALANPLSRVSTDNPKKAPASKVFPFSAALGFPASLNPPPANDSPKLSFALSSSASKPGLASSPNFSFGSSATPKPNDLKPSLPSGSSAVPKPDAPKLNLNFGSSAFSNTDAPSNGSKLDITSNASFAFGSSALSKPDDPKSSLPFGGSAFSTVPASSPSFSFGNPAAPKPDDPKVSLPFGGSSFSKADSSSSVPNSTLTFGMGTLSKPDASKTSFSFGGSAVPKPTDPKPSFAFGSSAFLNTSASSTSKPNSSIPFKFPTAPNSDSKPSFAFGDFSMPKSDAPKLNLTFGSSSVPKPDIPRLNLSFGGSDASKSTFSFGVTEASKLNSTSGIAPTPKLGPALGALANNTSENQAASDSENEGEGEGFSGARTNDALILNGEGEEEEESVAQARVKLLSLDPATKAYKDLGVGILKVNRHQVSKRQRLVCRAEGSGRILLNSYIPDDVKAEVISESKPISVRFKASCLDSRPTIFVARIKELADAKLLADAMKVQKP